MSRTLLALVLLSVLSLPSVPLPGIASPLSAQQGAGGVPSGGAPSAGELSGRVLDAGRDLPVSGIVVRLALPRPAGDTIRLEQITDPDGRFAFTGLEPGLWTLRIEADAPLRSLEQEVEIRQGVAERLEVRLLPETLVLEGITVRAPTDPEELRLQTLAVSRVDATDPTFQTSTPTDLLRRTAGVQVRQDGGVGSRAVFAIHGLSGNQVRILIDGVPAEFLGVGGQLSQLAVSDIERIEVYKGVVPVHLGGDALGGAIHVITRRAEQSSFRVGAGVGSFGAQRLQGGGRWVPASGGMAFDASAGLTRARNDYPIDVQTPDADNRLRSARVRRFHDAHAQHHANLRLSVLDRNWADDWTLSVSHDHRADELQHNARMAQPYGGVETTERTHRVMSTWRKGGPASRLELSAQLGATRTLGTLVDTTFNVYAWDGQVVRQRDYGGELSSSGNLLRNETDRLLGRGGLRLRTSERTTLNGQLLLASTSRTGRDPVAAAYHGYDPFRSPSTLDRATLGLSVGLVSFDERWVGEVGFKAHHLRSTGFSMQSFEYVPFPPQERSLLGGMASVRFAPRPELSANASWEYAARLPEPSELFGDFALTRPNPGLKPEVSHNLNAGVTWEGRRARAEVTGFARDARNQVHLQTSQFYAQYRNLVHTRTLGIEGGLRVTPRPGLDATVSGTYQDIRNQAPEGFPGSVKERYRGARLPNIPFLLGSAQATWVPERTWGPDAQPRLWWSAHHVHEFFLHWPVDGLRETKAVIPSQTVQIVGLALELPSMNLSLSAEIQNLLDRAAFDNFSVQRPGRQFQLRVEWTLAPTPPPGLVPTP